MTGERGMDPERYASLMHLYGLDQPLYQQYFSYLGKVIQGDLGRSIITQELVSKEFFTLFPATLELSLCAIIFAVVLGLPGGILAALKRNSFLDYSVMGASLTGYSMPIFWWALLLILMFSVTLGWTPVSGRIDILFDLPPVTGLMLVDSLLSGEEGAFKSAVMHLILPAIALGTIPLAVIARMTRSAMLEVLKEDYVRTARAKGLAESTVMFRHVLQNALIPILTGVVVVIPLLFMGSLVTESFFGIPGLGSYTIDDIQAHDFAVVRAMVFIGSVLYIVGLLLTDISYTIVDPRVRLD